MYSPAVFAFLREGSYSLAQGLSRPWIKSVSSMPAIVPWVMPMPLSPVWTKTLSASAGLRPV